MEKGMGRLNVPLLAGTAVFGDPSMPDHTRPRVHSRPITKTPSMTRPVTAPMRSRSVQERRPASSQKVPKATIKPITPRPASRSGAVRHFTSFGTPFLTNLSDPPSLPPRPQTATSALSESISRPKSGRPSSCVRHGWTPFEHLNQVTVDVDKIHALTAAFIQKHKKTDDKSHDFALRKVDSQRHRIYQVRFGGSTNEDVFLHEWFMSKIHECVTMERASTAPVSSKSSQGGNQTQSHHEQPEQTMSTEAQELEAVEEAEVDRAIGKTFEKVKEKGTAEAIDRPLTASSTSSKSRPGTAAPRHSQSKSVVSRSARPKSAPTVAMMRQARDWLVNNIPDYTPPVGLTLADWKKRGQYDDTTEWDPQHFKASDFIVEYISHQREAMKEAKRRAGLWKSGNNPTTTPARAATPAMEPSPHANVPLSEDKLHVKTVQALQKTPFERTAEEAAFLFQRLRSVKAFSKLSDFTLSELCKVMEFSRFENGRVIFRQGDFGTCWYVILRGKVEVQVSATGNVQDGVPVTTLSDGYHTHVSIPQQMTEREHRLGFGDLALVHDKPRAATILTLATTELIRVERADYNRIVKFIHQKDMQEKAMFLKKVPFFAEFRGDIVYMLASITTMKTFEKGYKLIEEGVMPGSFFIIKSGEFGVYRQYVDHGVTKQVLMRHVGPMDHCGEEGVLNGERADRTAKATIIVKSDTAEVGVITNYDATVRLKTYIPANEWSGWTESDVLAKLEEHDLKREWRRLRATTVNRIVQERTRDPNMTGFKFSKPKIVPKQNGWRV